MVKESGIKKKSILYVKPFCGIYYIKFSLYMQCAACKIVGFFGDEKETD